MDCRGPGRIDPHGVKHYPSIGAVTRGEGRLKKWNDERGFGSAFSSLDDADVVGPVSAFPSDGGRLPFETERTAMEQAGRSISYPDRQRPARAITVRQRPRYDDGLNGRRHPFGQTWPVR